MYLSRMAHAMCGVGDSFPLGTRGTRGIFGYMLCTFRVGERWPWEQGGLGDFSDICCLYFCWGRGAHREGSGVGGHIYIYLQCMCGVRESCPPETRGTRGIRGTMGTFGYILVIFRVGERCPPGTRGQGGISYIYWVCVVWGGGATRERG